MKEKLKNLAKKAIKLLAIGVAGTILIVIGIAAVSAYKTHVPVAKEGTCLVYNVAAALDPTEGAFQLTGGKIISNDIKEGSALILTDLGFAMFPIEVPFTLLRAQGFIRFECPKEE